jgi:hypothetical protein
MPRKIEEIIMPTLTKHEREQLKKRILSTEQTEKSASTPLLKLSTEGMDPHNNTMRFADKPGFACGRPLKDGLSDIFTPGQKIGSTDKSLPDGMWVAAVKSLAAYEIEMGTIKNIADGKKRITELFSKMRTDVGQECIILADSKNTDEINQKLNNVAIQSTFGFFEFKQNVTAFYQAPSVNATLEALNKETPTERMRNLTELFLPQIIQAFQDTVTDPSPKSKNKMKDLIQLSQLVTETVKALKDFDHKGDPKLIAMHILVEKALQKATADFIKGKDPVICNQELATQLRSIKNETKEAFSRTFGRGNKTVQLFSDRLLGVLKHEFPHYKLLPKVKVPKEETLKIMTTYKNIKNQELVKKKPALEAVVETRKKGLR